MKQYVIITVLLAILIAPVQMSAEDYEPGTKGNSSLPSVYNKELKEKREISQSLIREKRDSFLQEAKESRTEFRIGREGMTGNEKPSRAELEAQIKEKREALREEIEAIKKERVSTRKAFVENRFNQVIIVLTNAQSRIETKISELEDSHDMTEAKTHLEESKDTLAEAKTLLAALAAMTVSDSDESTATKPREAAKKIEELLKETRHHLVEAIHAMKAAVNPEDEDEEDDDDTSSDDSN